MIDEELMEDWVEVALGEVLSLSKAKYKPTSVAESLFYVGLEHIEKASSSLTGKVGYEEIKTIKNKFSEGQLLYGKLRPYLNKVYLAKETGVCSTDILVFDVPESLLGRYALFIMLNRKFVNDMSANTNGVNLPRVSTKYINNYKIPLPPLPIQRAIVSKIETLFSDLDNGVADLKKAQDQLKIYRQAVLKKAFEGELTKEWREQQSDLPTADELLKQIKEERENHYNQQLEDWKKAVKDWEENGEAGKKPGKPIKVSNLSELTIDELKYELKIPINWIYIKVGDLTDCIVPNRDKPKSFTGEIHWVTTPDLDEKSIWLQYNKVLKGLTREETILYNARVIPVNSVIMTCVGILGTSAIVEQEIVINQQLHAFLPMDFYVSRYLAYNIRYNQSYFNRSSTATTVQYLNKTKCNSLPFPLCSLPEQHQIVREIESRLSVCDKVEECIKQSLEKAQALRQSILKKAFEGKLLSSAEIEKCKAEADYEPASVLLERIRAERAAG